MVQSVTSFSRAWDDAFWHTVVSAPQRPNITASMSADPSQSSSSLHCPLSTASPFLVLIDKLEDWWINWTVLSFTSKTTNQVRNLGVVMNLSTKIIRKCTDFLCVKEFTLKCYFWFINIEWFFILNTFLIGCSIMNCSDLSDSPGQQICLLSSDLKTKHRSITQLLCTTYLEQSPRKLYFWPNSQFLWLNLVLHFNFCSPLLSLNLSVNFYLKFDFIFIILFHFRCIFFLIYPCVSFISCLNTLMSYVKYRIIGFFRCYTNKFALP